MLTRPREDGELSLFPGLHALTTPNMGMRTGSGHVYQGRNFRRVNDVVPQGDRCLTLASFIPRFGMVTIKESRLHKTECVSSGFVAPSRHLLDRIRIIHRDFGGRLAVHTKMPGWPE
jgi:hypothetical protein